MPAALLLLLAATATPKAEPSLVSSENFVVMAPGDQTASRVLAEAESLRRELAREWLGKELAEGQGPSIIHVRHDDDLNRGRTWPASGPRSTHHIIWVKSPPELTLSILSHELTHAVLASGVDGPLPIWADEGAASLRDDGERHATRRELLSRLAQSGRWPSLDRVLTADVLDAEDQSGYAVAVSLTEFLLTRGDKQQFVQFAREGKRTTWNDALRRYYEISSVTELTPLWRDWVAAEINAQQTAARQRGRAASTR